MPVRELGQDQVSPEAAEALPVGPAEVEAQEKFSAEGELPAVAPAAEVAALAPTASDLGFEGASNEQQTSDVHAAELAKISHGMVHWEFYKRQCELAGKPEMWQDDYVQGYTAASGWTDPSEEDEFNTFHLKPGQSASQALKDFIAGPTITDWHVEHVALEIDKLRQELGDKKFDQLFGSTNESHDSIIPADHRLRLASDDYANFRVDNMREVAARFDAAESEAIPVEEIVAVAQQPESEAPKEPEVDELVPDIEPEHEERLEIA